MPSWSRASGNSAAAAAAVKSGGKARLLGTAKQSATTEHELAESSDEVGLSRSRASGNSATATADVKSGGKARPSRIVKYSVTSGSESELAEDWELVRVALLQWREMW